MFGCVVAGRSVLCAQQVEDSKFLFKIPDGNSVNHICLFLLPEVSFPEEYGAGVYFGWPPYNDFKLLGVVSKHKPSAIFRLSNMISQVRTDDMDFTEDIEIQIGLSIEPLENLASLTKTENNSENNNNTNLNNLDTDSMAYETQFNSLNALVPQGSAILTEKTLSQAVQKFAIKILQNLKEYVLSFSKSVAPPSFGFGFQPEPAVPEVVPTDSFLKWYQGLQMKIEKDPHFWRDKEF